MTTTNPVTEACDQFLAETEEFGWWRGPGTDDGPQSTCMAISLSDLCGGEDTYATVADLLAIAATELFPGRVPEPDHPRLNINLTRFNDHPDTTLGDVRRVYDHAAAAWEGSS